QAHSFRRDEMMINSWIRRTTIAGIAIVALAAASHRVAGQTNGVGERFTALAVNMTSGGTATVQIVVNRWSTDAERDRLLSVLMDKGPDKLLDALRDTPKVGYIRSTESIGWDLHYARHEPGKDGGERVVLATDRPIGFWEAS